MLGDATSISARNPRFAYLAADHCEYESAVDQPNRDDQSDNHTAGISPVLGRLFTVMPGNKMPCSKFYHCRSHSWAGRIARTIAPIRIF